MGAEGRRSPTWQPRRDRMTAYGACLSFRRGRATASAAHVSRVACAIVVLKGEVITYASKRPNEQASGAVFWARHCRPSEALRA
jgi:hypothetical protein